MSVKELMSFAISARNLALAEQLHRDLVTPCSACFTVLNKTNQYFAEYPDLRKKLGQTLEAGGLSYSGNVKVRHILDIVVNDVGNEKLASLVTNPLEGLKVAPYYGCQIVRPGVDFDDPDDPQCMDRMIEALGATSIKYSMKTKCCGASLMGTQEKLSLRLCKNLLLEADRNGADCIITLCPLCQMNLDVYQSKVNRLFGTKFNLPVLYFTQLIGMAIGIPEKKLGFRRLAVKSTGALKKRMVGA
jgi:heterodisulfide reductase subunit B